MNKVDSITFSIHSIDFLRELYLIMDEFNINRIYAAYIDNDELLEAHQKSKLNFGKSVIYDKILHFLYNNSLELYTEIYKLYMKKYNSKLKMIFIKNNVKFISCASANLYDGIYVADDKFYIKNIDIKINDKVYHIDNLCLEI